MAGGGLAARLGAYHVQLMTVAGVSLIVSYYLTYWRRWRRGITLNKLILWVATVIFFVNLFLPIFVWRLMT